MALIKCPKCERSISDKASKCPKCGYPIQEYMSGKTEGTQTENVNDTSANNERSADIQKVPTQKESKKKFAACVVGVVALAFFVQVCLHQNLLLKTLPLPSGG